MYFTVVAVLGFGRFLESFFLSSCLMGKCIGLHLMAVIVSLLAFGGLFGFVGISIALLASAVLLDATRRARGTYL